MDPSDMFEASWGLIAVALLVLANGFFVAAEFSLVTIRRTRVEQALHEGRPGAASVDIAVRNLDSYIAACQLGITLASLALGWIGEPAFAGILEPLLGRWLSHGVSVAIAFALITALHVIVGELAPKGLALQYTERTAFIIAFPMRVFLAVFRPAIWLLNESGWAISRVFGVRRSDTEQSHLDASELRLVLRSSLQAGVLDESVERLLQRVLRFRDARALDAMIPRTEVVILGTDLTREQAIEVVRAHGHSRYPLCERDDLDKVVGIIHAKDLLLSEPETPLQGLVREPLLIPDHLPLDRVMDEMRGRGIQFALVVDEHGGIDGIVTLEDVVEEIVGELRDEFEPSTPETSAMSTLDEVDGLESVYTISERLGIDIPEGDYRTIGGLVVASLGRIPEVGDHVEHEGYDFAVKEMDGLRVATVEVSRVAPRE